VGWKEKLQIVKASVNEREDLMIVFQAVTGAPKRFIKGIYADFPFLGESYGEFLEETDGAQIDMFMLFGSGISGFSSVRKEFQEWGRILEGSGWLPIGKDALGDTFILTESGRVVLVDYQMDRVSDGRLIANSFDEFLDEVLMGGRFSELFPSGWGQEDENEWTLFMREQGWFSGGLTE